MKQNRAGKWLIAIIILVLGLGLLSAAGATGFTEVTSYTDLIIAMSRGDENIRLAGDITLSYSLVCARAMTLDLNGHKLDLAGNALRVDCDMNIIDTSANQSGKIYRASSSSSNSYAIDVGSSGPAKLTLESGGIIISDSHGVTVRKSSTLTVNGGTIYATRIAIRCEGEMTFSGGGIYSPHELGIAVTATGALTVNGGSISSHFGISCEGTTTVNSGTISAESQYGVYVQGAGTLTVNGGTISATNQHGVYVQDTGTLTVKGGTIQAPSKAIETAGETIVNGGTISATNQYGVYVQDTGTLTVNDGTITAPNFPVYDKGFVTIKGGTIQATDSVVIVAEGTEGAGKKEMLLVEGGLLELQGSGNAIQLKNCAAAVNGGTIKALYWDAGQHTGGGGIACFKDSCLTVNGGTISGADYGIMGMGTSAVPGAGENARIIITGGTISGEHMAGIYAAQLNGETNISGGKITGGTYGIEIHAGTPIITGGTFDSRGVDTVHVQDINPGKFIAGGTFTHHVTSYIKDGYWEVSDRKDAGPWTVRPVRKVTVTVEGKGTASAEHIVEAPYPHDADNTGKNIITKGMKFALSATPDAGWAFKEWKADPDETVIHKNKFTVGEEDVSIKAVFEKIPVYTVTVTNDGNGKGAANPGSGNMGTEVTLIASPSDGYRFKEWQVITGGVTVADNKFTIGTADVEVKAIFEKIPEPDPATIVHTVTVTSDGNGLGAANPASGVSGTEVTLVAAPSDGYQFREWKVISGGVTIEKNTFRIGTTDVEVQAIFEKIPEPAAPDDSGSDPNPDSNPDPATDTYNVKVTSDGNGLGAADPASGKTGTEVTLTYAPFEGYRFREWQVISGGVTVTDNRFTIGTANVEIKAVFEKAPEPEPETYTVKVTSDGNGLGVADPTSGVTGTEVTLVYAPFEGFQFKEWQVVSGGITIEKNKFTIGTSNVEIKAVFEKIPEPTSVVVAGGKYELAANKKSAIFVGPEKKNAKTLVIQDTVKINGRKYKVTEIAAGACKGMSKLTTLTIGKNVKTIGKEAFNKCKKAKTIKILGTALKKVGANAFAGTPKKAVVTCPKKKIKAYTKLLQNAGLSKKATFKELK